MHFNEDDGNKVAEEGEVEPDEHEEVRVVSETNAVVEPFAVVVE